MSATSSRLGGQCALPGQVFWQAGHVQLGGHAEGERLGEVAIEGVGVRVDEAGQDPSTTTSAWPSGMPIRSPSITTSDCAVVCSPSKSRTP
jgi:hypothetical protein